jgi:hypothetical protein
MQPRDFLSFFCRRPTRTTIGWKALSAELGWVTVDHFASGLWRITAAQRELTVATAELSE